MRLRTLGAVCATSAVAVPVVPPASAQDPAPPAVPAVAAAPAAPIVTPPGDMHTTAVARLSDRHLYFARRYHRLLGDPLSRPQRQQMRVQLTQLTPPTLRSKTSHLRHDIRKLRSHLEDKRAGGAPDIPIPPQLNAIARCESHGNPRAVSAGGTYRGKYQFDFTTWRSVGGSGDPAAASETEQDRRAAKLYRSAGAGRWPVCGR